MGAGHISPFARPESQPSNVAMAEEAWRLKGAMITAGVIALEGYYATPANERVGDPDEAVENDPGYQASSDEYTKVHNVLYLEGLAQ